MEYILKGDPNEVSKVIRENRIRVQRGVISFTPVGPESDFEEADTNLETTGSMDGGYIEVEDVKNVNLDADDKTPADNDAKDIPEADSKETPAARKTSRRSKKSE